MDLTQLWALVRRHWLVLLAFLVLGVGIGSGVSYLQPRVYSATTTGYVVAGSSETVGDAMIGKDLAADKAASYLPLAQSRSVAEAVAAELGISPDAVSLSATNQGVIFTVKAKAHTPQLASDMANAGIRATSLAANDLETMTISGQSTGETVVRIVPVEMANTPTRPISPNWMQNLALGLLLGALAGFGFLILRQTLDRKIRNSADLSALAGTSVLGVIPHAPGLSGKSGSSVEQGIAAEALRKLRTNLRYVSVDDPLRSIVITSANESEGKSTIALHLARMFAEAGHPTIIIDADLRRPTLADRFSVYGQAGLTQVLAGTISIDDALITISDSLRLLPAGKIPPNPSELLGSRRMRNLIETLSLSSIVILDAPPLLPVTDAGLLAGISDGTILVTKYGKTRKEEVAAAAQNVAGVNKQLSGAVINDVPEKYLGAASYGQNYSSYHSHHYYQSNQENLAAESSVVAPEPAPLVGEARRRGVDSVLTGDNSGRES